jgi:proton-dependent oligopeptide transporter, POT family
MISTTLPEAATPSIAERRQPLALWNLFLTEMWERFSYYGMRALLVLYLTKALGYARGDALAVYAVFTGLVYLTPMVGGYVADRLLGFRKAILTGGIVMMCGNLAMTVPALLHLGLGLLIVGNGFFKPNISSLVGRQYQEKDPRRDAGFTIFYMGINLGAFVAPLVAGTLGERVDWRLGFGSAAVGMAIGLIQFTAWQGRLGTSGLPPGRDAPAHLLPRDWLHIALLSLAAIPFVYVALAVLEAAGSGWALVPLQVKIALPFVLVGWLLFRAGGQGGRQDLERVLAIIVLGMFNVFFWMGFEQAGGTMNLFADKLTDRVVFGWLIPASSFQAVNPLAILALAPVLSALWKRLDSTPRALSSPTKMAIGLVILGLGFVVMEVAQRRADLLGMVGPLWLVCVYIVHTTGELCISPVGLSMVTRVAPTRTVGLMMGVWFASFGVANYLAGRLESLLQGSGVPLYQFLATCAISAGIVLLLMVPLLKRWMHGHA